MIQHEPPNPESPESYTVAWICALEEEYFCASRMLDDEFARPEIPDDKDDNTYIFGRIAKHYVVIGCLPAGRYGTNSASRVARDMVRTFPHLRFALMVGIGGGAPTAQNDVRLGDVVVSQPMDGFGGVIQYDLGKTLQSGQFQRNGQLNAPPEKLLGVIPEMRRLYMDKKKPDRLAEHLQRLDDMEEYQKPALDHLYKADYLHASGEDCNHCDSQSLVDRQVRSNHRAVSVHYGNIASGNTVVKDAKMRDLYAKDPALKVLCFEMEAAGLMNNIPCLVIRGICDYCDSHKNDAWHNYAALTAAAYARELLLILRSQRVDSMPHWAERIKQELQQANQGLANLNIGQRALQTSVDSIDQKIDWSNLPIAEDAAFDSYMDQCEDECLPGTRTELLSQIKEWALSAQGKTIFWLQGRAGTGKSTISRTIARFFQKENILGASFFFKRGEGDRGTARKFFPTIIKRLVILIPQLVPAVQEALTKDPELATKGLHEQFDKLLFQPLQSLEATETLPSIVVIVLDALDEGEPDREICSLLRSLRELRDIQSISLRVFLTSRPEWSIIQEFSKISDHEYKDLVLHEVPEAVVHHDVSLFLKHRLSSIQTSRSLPSHWPEDSDFDTLVKLSVPLFIFAATACRILEDHRLDPEAILAEILAHKNDGSEFDATYRPVLDRFLQGQTETKKWRLVQEFHERIGVIIMLESPLSVISLAKLLNLPERHINITLDSFHSVLNIPVDLTQPVRTFHLSFREYLLDPETRKHTPLGLDEKGLHYHLAIKCLTVCETLRKNICELRSDGFLRMEVDDRVIDHHFQPELRYSCRYWAHHTAQCMEYNGVPSRALSFLKRHFLHWMEAMSLLSLKTEVLGAIHNLQSAMQGDRYSELSEFLYDAKRFILKNHHIADKAPLQLYCAGLIFAPTTSIIRQEFRGELPFWISQFSQAPTGWSTEIQRLEGHTSAVNAMAFSPDGRLLASSSHDRSIRLWDHASGILQQTIQEHTASVGAEAFSPNGRLIASGSGHAINIWDLASGVLQHTLKGHERPVLIVAFSPDSRLIASGSEDATIRVWDPASGVGLKVLKGHTSWALTVAFSPDGRLIASGSYDTTARVWDLASGSLKQTLKGSQYKIRTVTFSPDGKFLASKSDRTIWLWDPASGIALKVLNFERSGVRTVAFSPNSKMLAASFISNAGVWLWNLASGTVQYKFEGHSFSVQAIAFSPDSRLLASGSRDPIIRLWDLASGTLQQRLEGHSSSVREVTFSPDGRLLASASGDLTVRLWDLAAYKLEDYSGSSVKVALSPASESQLPEYSSDSSTAWLQDPAMGAVKNSPIDNLSQAKAVTFSPNGQILASTSYDSTVRLWDPTSGALKQTLKGHTPRVEAVAFSPDGQILASGSSNGLVRLWDPVSGILLQTLEGPVSEVKTVVFSPDGRLLASGAGTLQLWDPVSGALLRTLECGESIEALAFSPDGRLLASGSDSVELWDPASGVPQKRFDDNAMWSVSALAFSPDGRLLVCNSGDDTELLLWDVASGVLQQTFPLDLTVKEIEFTSDGLFLKIKYSKLELGIFKTECSFLQIAHGPSFPRTEIFIRDEWVELQGDKVLWLPTEYRPVCSESRNNTIALGLVSGRVVFLGFRV